MDGEEEMESNGLLASPSVPTIANRMIKTPRRLLQRRRPLPLTTPDKNKTPKNLLDLAAELRNIIWHYAVVSDRDVSLKNNQHKGSLARVSKQVYSEVMPIYFKKNTFSLGNHFAGHSHALVTLNSDLQMQARNTNIPITIINNFSALLHVHIWLPLAPFAHVFYQATHFFHLELRHIAPGQKKVTLRAIPHYRAQRKEPEESCVCPLQAIVEVLDGVVANWIQGFCQLVATIPSCMPLPTVEVCEKCKKRKLCRLDHPFVQEVEKWWKERKDVVRRFDAMQAAVPDESFASLCADLSRF